MRTSLAAGAAISLMLAVTAVAAEDTLWYPQPAQRWVEALPVGNGHLGAMVFGGVEEEHLQLNEDTLWAGEPYDPARPGAAQAIVEARALVFAGKEGDAAKVINDRAMSNPKKQLPYQTMGDLRIDFATLAGPALNYRRSLDLAHAEARVTYQSGGVTFTREIFCSAPDDVMVIHLSADQPGRISFSAALSSPQQGAKIGAEGKDLVLTGTSGDAQGIKGRVRFMTRLAIQNDGGSAAVKDGKLEVNKADAVALLLSAATNYVSWQGLSGDPAAKTAETLSKAQAFSSEQLRARHVADFTGLFSRVAFDLPAGENAGLPTDERILRFGEGKDASLASLFFQFGRYLLISSSRPGRQPANLQGIWNDSLTPSWGSKYTININTEMNYWPAETTNLSECTQPLFQMIRELSVSGARTASGMYGARGWMAHHNTDAWRATGPVDYAPTGMWPMGGAWLCTHLWQHYLFGGDRQFLAGAYPLMKGASEFFLDTLVEHPKYHWLVTCPSYSPENGPLCAGPTMDNQLLRDLLGQTAEAARVLDVDDAFRRQLLDTRAELPPEHVGRFGQLQEWLEDRDDPNDHNRHVSHLYGLFPSNQISAQTPEFFKAARISLEHRGDAGTGWSLAWKINFWARLLDGDHAMLILYNLLTAPGSHGKTFDSGGGVFPNLFDAHDDHTFQIDGNLGATAGIAEMLLQSQSGEIVLLPALPGAWPEGRVRGLRARGGYEVGIAWAGGKLVAAEVRNVSATSGTLVRDGDRTARVDIPRGQAVRLNAALGAL
jgi:alpha-L-fucosidase 2